MHAQPGGTPAMGTDTYAVISHRRAPRIQKHAQTVSGDLKLRSWVCTLPPGPHTDVSCTYLARAPGSSRA